jgi:hypothetical protein
MFITSKAAPHAPEIISHLLSKWVPGDEHCEKPKTEQLLCTAALH